MRLGRPKDRTVYIYLLASISDGEIEVNCRNSVFPSPKAVKTK
jgi:hypothetical protein